MKKAFIQTVWDYYHAHGRDLPWRHTHTPYHILVSEIMLQQTQAHRVAPKYKAFLKAFPSMRALAEASARDVLAHWSGLGYNRRALNLHRLAKDIVEHKNGKLPQTHPELVALPGIGPYTAGAIMAFAFNLPHPILETNIRTVYIHHFFNNRTDVSDRELLELVTDTLDTENPREWYWALMDYGSHLKATVGNISRQSKTYTKQSPFKDSDRAIRGAILRALLTKPKQTASALTKTIEAPKDRIETQLQSLAKDGFIVRTKTTWSLI